MRQIKLGRTGADVPVIAVGCMRMAGITPAQAEKFIGTSLELGLNFFDHADIYGGGKSEEVFAQALGKCEDDREKVIIQSKCGIVPGKMYDFSKEHIISSVEGSLKRLGTDYLDVLLLHRPDALAEPEEISEAFTELSESGKVKYFGVSNQNPQQIRLLQKYIPVPIAANQLQLSITNATMISNGINVNIVNDPAIDRDGGILDFCRLEDITIQPWSPFQYGTFEGVFIDSDKFPQLNAKLGELADEFGCTKTTISLAWLLRHPAKFQPVVGTMNPGRLTECAKAADIYLSREQWYSIYLRAGNKLP